MASLKEPLVTSPQEKHSAEYSRRLAILLLLLLAYFASSETSFAQDNTDNKDALATLTCQLLLLDTSEPFEYRTVEHEPIKVKDGETETVRQKAITISCPDKPDLSFILIERDAYIGQIGDQDAKELAELQNKYSWVIPAYKPGDGNVYDADTINRNFNCNAFVMLQLGERKLITGLNEIVSTGDWDPGEMLNSVAHNMMTQVFAGNLNSDQFNQNQLQANDVILLYKGNEKENGEMQTHSMIVTGTYNDDGRPFFLSKLGPWQIYGGDLMGFSDYYGTAYAEVFRVEQPITINTTQTR